MVFGTGGGQPVSPREPDVVVALGIMHKHGEQCDVRGALERPSRAQETHCPLQGNQAMGRSLASGASPLRVAVPALSGRGAGLPEAG